MSSSTPIVKKEDLALILKNEDDLVKELLDHAFDQRKDIKWYNVVKKDSLSMYGTVTELFKDFKNNRNNNGVQTIKGSIILTDPGQLTPYIFYRFMDGFTKEHVEWEQHFEETCEEAKPIKYIDLNHTICYCSYKSKYFGISSRDFCYLKTRRLFKSYDLKNHKIVKITKDGTEEEDEDKEEKEKDENSNEIELPKMTKEEWLKWEKNIKNKDIYCEISLYFYHDILEKCKYYHTPKKNHVRGYTTGGVLVARKTPFSNIELIFVSRMDMAGYIPQWLVNYAIGSKADAVIELKNTVKKVVKHYMSKRNLTESN